jgi:AbrB family looped-hinge helix DNA binding protein
MAGYGLWFDNLVKKLYIKTISITSIKKEKLMSTVRALAKGQVVIPVEIRKKYHIEPGTEMQIMEYGGIIYLIPPVEDPIKTACGILPAKPSLSESLLKERKKEFRQ